MTQTTPEWVRKIRRQLKLTQAQLASKLGVTPTSVSRWERGLAEPTQLSVESLEWMESGQFQPPSIIVEIPPTITEDIPTETMLALMQCIADGLGMGFGCDVETRTWSLRK